jgi:hypothetical protein
LNLSSTVTSLEKAARNDRHRLFMAFVLSLDKPATILDVGGTTEYWKAFFTPASPIRRVVLLNTFEQRVFPPFESVTGDACDLSRYAGRSFDVVFSNSVLGHVGGFSHQLHMATEIRRVAFHYFVQTPNHAFPIDWRTLVPFFHLLPVGVQAWCFQSLAMGRYSKAKSREEAEEWASRVRNVRRKELRVLFPGATVIDERMLGWTKSFMVHNFPQTRAAGFRDL